MSSSSYSSPFGSGLSKLAGAFTPSAQRQLLGARAQGIGARTLASQLKAQQSQFDLDNQREAIQSLRDQSEANPENMDMQNSLLGMLSGNPSSYATSLSAYGKEGREVNQEKQYQDSLKNLGDKGISIQGANGPINIGMADLFKLRQNISQMGSASVTPSAIAKNKAQTLGYTQETDAVTQFQGDIASAIPGQEVRVNIGTKENPLLVSPKAFRSPQDYLKTNNLQITGENLGLTGQGIGLANTGKVLDNTQKRQKIEFDENNNPVLTSTNVVKLEKEIAGRDLNEIKAEIALNTQGDVELYKKHQATLEGLKVALKTKENNLGFVKGTLKHNKDGTFTAVGNQGQQVQISVASGENNKVIPNDLQKVELTDKTGAITEVMFVSPTTALRTMNELRAIDKDPKKVYSPRELGAVGLGFKTKFDKILKGVPRTQLMNKYNKGKQVVERIKESMEILQNHPEVAGLVGKFTKFSEFTKQFNNVAIVKKGNDFVMWNKATKQIVKDPATRFALNVVFLKAGSRKALIGESRVSDSEQKIVNEIVDGQSMWTNPPTAMEALSRLGSIMEDFREVASVGLDMKDFTKNTFGNVVTDLGISAPNAQAPAPVQVAPQAQGVQKIGRFNVKVKQ